MSGQHPRLRKVFGFALFLSLATILLALSAHWTLLQRAAVRESAALQSDRDRLQEIAENIEVKREQAESDRRIILSVLAHARTAADIPALGGNRIVSQHQGIEELRLYVPEGNHMLVIAATWKPAVTKEPLSEADLANAADAGEMAWDVPLLPACGYFLKFVTDRQGGELRWELTGNHAAFSRQSEVVPIGGFAHQGSSWSGTDVVQFPNQIERFSIDELEAAAADRAGVELMNFRLNGKRNDRNYEIAIKVRLQSDGPSCVSASDAQRIIVLGRQDLLQPYADGGKYEIRISGSTPLRSKQ